jgi:hypothetical protein
VITVTHAQETNLAWALIDAAKPHMNIGERNYAVVTVGAGDTFPAICQLLKLIAAKHIPLRPHLVQLCRRWLDAYALHEEYERLRCLMEGFVMPDTIQAATTIGRLSALPKRGGIRASTLSTRRLPAERPRLSRALQ